MQRVSTEQNGSFFSRLFKAWHPTPSHNISSGVTLPSGYIIHICQAVLTKHANSSLNKPQALVPTCFIENTFSFVLFPVVRKSLFSTCHTAITRNCSCHSFSGKSTCLYQVFFYLQWSFHDALNVKCTWHH